MSVVLITGASSGIGRLTALAAARAGHVVWASVRDATRTAAQSLRDLADAESLDLRVIELDVLSDDSVRRAVAEVVDRSGRLDVVVHNAGHMVLGYTEAFTPEDLTRLFELNAASAQRVNRAVLPHLRRQRAGVLVYVGSTTPVSVPPFLTPYVASKAAFDILAQATAYEVGRFGIETVIVMPGAFVTGTEHFANAGRPSDPEAAREYAELDPLLARNEEATRQLFDPDVDADPVSVADEIVRVLALPVGEKPLRTVVDFTRSHVARVNEVALAERDDFIRRMGYAELLRVEPPEDG